MSRSGPPPESVNTHSMETTRLWIAVPERHDAAELYALVGGPDRSEVCATLIWEGPNAVSEVETWIERSRTEAYRDWGYHWTIRDRTGSVAGQPGRPLGSIGIRPRGSPGRADVGYWLGKPYWGRGIMTEALMQVIRLGFSELRHAKIEADVFAHNGRGRRLVESVGMTREGTTRRAYRKRGRWVDLALYGILPEEHAAFPAG